MRRTWTLAVTFLLAPLLLVGCSFNGSASTAEPTSMLSLLYVASADGGTFTEGADGNFQLTLTGLDPDVVMFSDRPKRAAGSLSATELLAHWSENGFDTDPPNVTLMLRTTADRDAVVGTLSSPSLDASGTTLAATFTLLESVPEGSGATSKPLSRSELPSQFTDVSLFIDDASYSGCPTTTVWVSGAGPDCLFYVNLWIPFDSSF